jgi:spore coat polysaccharide biosynthesis protein SpsF (cytidylyltransferase family)
MVGAIIQARMSSSRLEGKVMMPIFENLSLLELLIMRLKQSLLVEKIVLATSFSQKDDILVKVALKHGISVFRGSETNVLQRFIGACEQYNIQTVVRVCADSPLIDGVQIDLMIKEFQERDYDLLTVNPNETRLLDGVEITSQKALKNFFSYSQENLQYLEHVTLYAKKETPHKVKYFTVSDSLKRTDILVTIDTKKDFDRVKTFIKEVFIKEHTLLFSIEKLPNYIQRF